MAIVLDGKLVATARKALIQDKITRLSASGIIPGLAILLVGDDAASHIYTKRMAKLAESIGLAVFVKELPATATQVEVLALMEELNQDNAIHGILPMMPLPSHLDADALIASMNPAKDVDGLHTVNIGLVAAGKRNAVAPCTPRAVMAILEHFRIDVAGKRAVIIGRSNVVGKPLIHLLLAKNATVTVCHSKTHSLAEVISQGDIVIAAVGKAHMVTAAMIKLGAVVIDVGINEVDGAVVGDVDYEAVTAVAGAITPVPGGVGSVTTTMLLEAVLKGLDHD